MNRINWNKRMSKAQSLLIDMNKPMHYKDIYNKICPDITDTNNKTRNVENFRNYLAYHSKRFSHIGLGIFGLKRWYLNIPSFFTEMNCTLIHRDSKIVRESYHESIDREPYMLNKYNEPFHARLYKIGEGLTAEKHVIDVYTKMYGDNVVLPKNDVKTYSEFDFGIKTPIRTFFYDVKSTYSNNNFLYIEKYRMNYNVDFFLKVSRLNDVFIIEGIADKNTIRKHALLSQNGKQLMLHDKYLINEQTICLFINHCVLNIDCSKIHFNGNNKEYKAIQHSNT